MLAPERKKAEERFLDVYEREADGLFRFVFFRIHERPAALDVVSETYLRTWRYLHEGHDIDNLRAFLYHTARNIIIDTWRSDAREKSESLDQYIEESGEPPDMTPPPAYDPLDLERAMKLLEELEPPEYKEVLLLRYIEEWTLKEIAECLEVSENVVSVRINRAIKKLGKTFQHEPI